MIQNEIKIYTAEKIVDDNETCTAIVARRITNPVEMCAFITSISNHPHFIEFISIKFNKTVSKIVYLSGYVYE